MDASLSVETAPNAGATLIVTLPPGRPNSNRDAPPIANLAEAA